MWAPGPTVKAYGWFIGKERFMPIPYGCPSHIELFHIKTKHRTNKMDVTYWKNCFLPSHVFAYGSWLFKMYFSLMHGLLLFFPKNSHLVGMNGMGRTT